jgi:TetR/AcrR family tetracycline transcriptional repressor
MERDGYDAVSTRSVAAELGVRPGALYWHVKSRAALDDLMFDRLLADFDFQSDSADWRRGLNRFAHYLRRYLRAHRDMVRLWRGRLVLGPNVLSFMEKLLTLLRAGGLSGRPAAHAYAAILDYVLNFSAVEAGTLDHPEAHPEALEAKEQLYATLSALPRDRYPSLAALARPLTHFDDVDERFQFGLDALIGWIDHLSPSTARRPLSTPPAGLQRPADRTPGRY